MRLEEGGRGFVGGVVQQQPEGEKKQRDIHALSCCRAKPRLALPVYTICCITLVVCKLMAEVS